MQWWNLVPPERLRKQLNQPVMEYWKYSCFSWSILTSSKMGMSCFSWRLVNGSLCLLVCLLLYFIRMNKFWLLSAGERYSSLTVQLRVSCQFHFSTDFTHRKPILASSNSKRARWFSRSSVESHKQDCLDWMFTIMGWWLCFKCLISS